MKKQTVEKHLILSSSILPHPQSPSIPVLHLLKYAALCSSQHMLNEPWKKHYLISVLYFISPLQVLLTNIEKVSPTWLQMKLICCSNKNNCICQHCWHSTSCHLIAARIKKKERGSENRKDEHREVEGQRNHGLKWLRKGWLRSAWETRSGIEETVTDYRSWIFSYEKSSWETFLGLRPRLL